MRKINRQPFFVVALFYTVLGTLITTAAFIGLSHVPGYTAMQAWVATPRQLITSFILSLCISAVLTTIWQRRVGELQAQIELAEERERTESAQRAATEASLRALQAQIEPHFLFNTLANVTGLIHTQPDKAKLMLETFIAYLRATLATTRDQTTTLGAEFDMMKTFLIILQIRMGDRLKVRFDLPDDMRDVMVPPMLLQPLVENAIKHGLEPKIEGGEVSLAARRDGTRVAITVADTGLGFQNTMSNGIGLKNVRERVRQIYGDDGSVSIEENRPSGTRITIAMGSK
jgi:LytS/YehU family sensor histidine kinase